MREEGAWQFVGCFFVMCVCVDFFSFLTKQHQIQTKCQLFSQSESVRA